MRAVRLSPLGVFAAVLAACSSTPTGTDASRADVATVQDSTGMDATADLGGDSVAHEAAADVASTDTPRTDVPSTDVPSDTAPDVPGDTAPDALPDADTVLTVDPSTVVATSHFVPGASIVDTSLRTPWTGNDPASVTAARAVLGSSIARANVFVMAWGNGDPWPDPTQAEPTQWSSLDGAMQIALGTGAEIELSLCEAPWWMKGQRQPGGTTTVLTSADEWNPIAYASRVLDDHMNDWTHLVQRAAERYMAPPYNVRRFQVWNELKGYYDPDTNAWDYDTSAGDPSGPNALHGYTFMYNQVYATLLQVASNMGIGRAELHVGGPYVVVDSGADRNFSNPSMVSGLWGVLDQRPLDVITYWLAHATGYDFVTVDGGNDTRFGTSPLDDFGECDKLASVDGWIRTDPHAATVPIDWAEWYGLPHMLPDDPATRTAIGSYALMQHVLAGTETPLIWADDGVLWTSTSSAGGGMPTGLATTMQWLRADFSAGASLVSVTSSSPDVFAIATSARVLMVNRSSNAHTVRVGSSVVMLPGYGVARR